MSLVSVIIPTYNRADFLAQAVDSVLQQNYRPVELIVVDDGSTDDTRRILSSYGERLRTVYQPNQGPAAARNAGIAEARGDYLAFLDSDDWWHSDKLTLQVAAMEGAPEYLISHTDELWYRRGKLLNQKKKHARPHGEIFSHCLPLCCVGMSTVVARPLFFAEVGLFDEGFPCCEDYELWLRASVRLPFLKVDEALTFKQGGRSDQVSQLFRVGMDRFRIFALLKLLRGGELSAEQQALLSQELSRKARIYGQGCLKHNRAREAEPYLELALKIKEGKGSLATFGKYIDSFQGKSDD